tara:strand:+ start:125 stop:505 length:381 start_codon:yes stop_codon:yes gene_type:complete
MNIKKIITGLALLMLLSSGTANADWGDVYYCQMTNRIDISLDGKIKTLKPQTFTFKLDESRNAMVYGDKGYFKDGVEELTEGKAWPSQEAWQAKSTYAIVQFIKGNFLYSMVAAEVTSISADCEKF